jgi:hypothetical protein
VEANNADNAFLSNFE